MEAVPETDPPMLDITMDTLESWYNDGFLIGLRQAAELLSPELQELSDKQDKEREERKKKALNPKGGMGVKGGHTPTPLVGANPAAPQASGAPAQ